MTVTPPVYDCSIPTPRILQDSYEYDLPRSGDIVDRVVMQSYADFIASPTRDCLYSYSLEMCDGGPSLPPPAIADRYTLRNDGRLSFTVNGDEPLINDRLRISISSVSIDL